MRFTKLAVECFQAIERAELEFAPGLNVLYGPNDIGKSTLATAIRAALLVPPASSEAAAYAPWFADATPRVSLTFVDDAGHHWKVKKGFGSGSNSAAELFHSKDGTTFTLDSKARQVEERIRAVLAWGIPPPGGRGGPRGLPSSFLANALLAAQTDVVAILDQSLTDDLDGSGKLRLTKALATLAQDPVFKKVLDAAQHEVDLCFSASGKRKRGRSSKFTEAGDVVKRLSAELAALEHQCDESSAIEQSVQTLRERRAAAMTRVDEAQTALTLLRQHFERAKAHQEVRVRCEEAQAALARIDAEATRVHAMATEVSSLATGVAAQEREVARLAAACDAADVGLRAAEEAHRIATSEDSARQRELRRAQLSEQAAGLAGERQRAEGRKTKAEAAIKARDDVAKGRSELQSARDSFEALGRELAEAREALRVKERDLELARAIVAYGRWRSASLAVEEQERAKESAAKLRADADTKEAEAGALDGRARAIEDAVRERQSTLPSEQTARTLTQLERELEVAEAALGGGIGVAVRPRAPVAVRAVVDQREAIDEASLATERLLEADRSIVLSVGDLVDIEITAGAADKRRAVEELRARWKAEGVPILVRAQAPSMVEVGNALATLTNERTAAKDLRAAADGLRSEATSLRGTADVHEAQAAKLAAATDDLEARAEAIAGMDRALLETHLATLGKAWEAQADALHAAKASEVQKCQALVNEKEQAHKLAEHRVAEAEKRVEELATASERAAACVEGDPAVMLKAIDEELTSVALFETETNTQLAAVVAQASSAANEAQAAMDLARSAVRSAKDEHARAAAALDVARADLHARIGQHAALQSQLEARDRAGAEALVEQRRRELSVFGDEPAVSETDIVTAERQLAAVKGELEEVKEELHKSEGALSKVGGAAVREEVERVREALDAASDREKDLEVDAEAWKLLLETLREVENEESAHLGSALAQPVASKFVELTGGRYRGLRLGASLKTEAVDLRGAGVSGSEVLEALSIGIRDQLATLIRLTIAEQLSTAIVLDDHLVHTDPSRLAWFRDILLRTALNAQVVVLTCRPEDYLVKDELPDGTAVRDLAGGTLRAIDVVRVVKRWEGALSRPPAASVSEEAHEHQS